MTFLRCDATRSKSPATWRTSASPFPTDEFDSFNRQIHRYAALVEDAQDYAEHCQFLLEELRAQVEEQTNRNIYILTTFSAIFLPATLIAGIWGMNVGGIPFSGSPNGFWVVGGLLAAFFAMFAIVILRFALRIFWHLAVRSQFASERDHRISREIDTAAAGETTLFQYRDHRHGTMRVQPYDSHAHLRPSVRGLFGSQGQHDTYGSAFAAKPGWSQGRPSRPSIQPAARDFTNHQWPRRGYG
jgi:hypothetical protein